MGFVVERYKAIENFVPEDFWKIRGNVLAVVKKNLLYNCNVIVQLLVIAQELVCYAQSHINPKIGQVC